MAALCLGLLATDTLWARSLSVSLSPSNYNGYPISCIGARDGSIDATVTGGTPPYSYTWTNQATTQDITGLMAGYYKLTVVDGTLAMASADITLDQPDDLKVTMQPYTYPSGHNISCHDCFNGSIDAEKTAWGAHPYVIQYLDEYRKNQWQGWPANPYDMKWYFYQNGDPQYTDEGVFYYWKRRYKYMMSRWGYSVNIAAIEPFNETDQLLSYKNLAPGGLGTNTPLDTCNSETQPDEEDIPFRGLCRENRGPWQRDPLLPGIVDQWLTDLIGYIRGDVDTADVVGSPLGEKEKLFIMSYTDYMPASSIDLFTGVYLPDHYKPFTNPQVDMIDVHRGMNVYTGDDGAPDDAISGAYEHALSFRSNYPYANPSLGDRCKLSLFSGRS